MSDDPRYSIAVCNYNMVETLEASLRSMVDQVDPERFEVVVVDGGSTDGSRDVLRELEAEYPTLRAVLDRSDECNWLGGDRNISFQESRGEYVLESLDTDDRYVEGVIEDFVRIFEALNDAREGDFFLSGTGMNVAPRRLLLDVPYYDLGGAEDRDLWRRLFARRALVWLDHGQVSESLGYDFDLRGEIRRDIHGKVADFESGISLESALRWTVSHEHFYILEQPRGPLAETAKRLYDAVTFPYAYLKALGGTQRHAAPPGFERKGALEAQIAASLRTLQELESEYGFHVDRDAFSPNGYEAFVEYGRERARERERTSASGTSTGR
jgi:glycosyltransferase involved in cell wall biosynthesis